jgi:hypothetical protein
MTSETRLNEWFVPRFGPPRFRAFVGLLFLPYTGMCVSFTVIGAMLAPDVHWERAGAIALIYALALGVGAHAADTIGSKKAKPWGRYFTRRQMLALMAGSLVAAYAIGTYYIVVYSPALAIIAALEGFFLLAYNFELWNGRFHTNFWFAVSWGALPVAAGYVIMTNSFGVLPAVAAAAAAVASYAEIRISRPYKELKKAGSDAAARKLEAGLKIISISTMTFALVLVAARLAML